MGKYFVHWTMEQWFRVEIEADSAEQALEKFDAHEYEESFVKNVGAELQDSVTVEEVK